MLTEKTVHLTSFCEWDIIKREKEVIMERYRVTGMSCAACSSRVEKAVSAVPGVRSCSVSLLTNSMGVEGSASTDAIIAAVTQAGYGAALYNNSPSAEQTTADPELDNHEVPIMRRRLWSSLLFLIVLMYLSMGHVMWNWPLPAGLAENPAAIGLTQLLLTGIVMVINQKFFINGFKGLIRRSPNMDTLVALGSSAAFGYSTFVLYRMSELLVNGETAGAVHCLHDLYFESAAMILTLITVGKLLEARAKGKTTSALQELLKMKPQTACVLRDGNETVIPASELRKGEIFLVRPGESIPADGIVIQGESAVNESALTGESIPVDKACGDTVSAATINQSGFLQCEAVKVGGDTVLSQIIRMVSDAAATKAPIAKIADRVSGIFVPCVIGIALVTMIVWLLCGQTVGFAIARGISVLVISCPCALGLATPVAIMVGSGKGAKNGILFKTAASLEAAGRTEIVVLDKTGTITKGEPSVTDLIPASGVTEEELLTIAFSLELKSEHPLAAAIVSYCREKNLTADSVTEFKALPGNGLSATHHGKQIHAGSLKYMESLLKLDADNIEKAAALSSEGKTPLFFSEEQRFLGMIAVADTLKEDSTRAIQELRNMGIRVLMLTGDNALTANAIGKQAGVDEVVAGVLPDGKEAVIRRLLREGKVAMVGDGINDAPALTRADIGIAIGAGTDVAIDAADIVLMKSRLSDVPAAIRLSRGTLRNIHENLFWAFIYNVIGIPLAAGVWIPLFQLELNPMFGAAAMSLSSFCVVTNALRLNLFQLYRTDRDRPLRRKHKKEKKTMNKTLKITGMMCPHCEATVKKALEAIEGVAAAEVSHKEGTAVVTLTEAVDDAVLKKTVEDKDFTVTEIV